jgi:uncharacterized membrane protein
VPRRLAAAFLAIASPIVLVLCVVPGAIAEWSFALLVAAYPVALILFAVGGRRRLGVLGLGLIGLLILLESSVIVLLLLRGRVVDGPWVVGLPAAAVVQVVGLCLIPLPLVGLLYAMNFDRFGLAAGEPERNADRNIEPGGES